METTGESRLSLGLTSASAYLKDTECFIESDLAQGARCDSNMSYLFSGAGTVGIASLTDARRECLVASTRPTGESRLSLGLTGASAFLKATECFPGSNMAQRACWNSERAYSSTWAGTAGIASLAYAV
ncbi:hypothetical protein QAD02_021260 [Eretmocerus hayati]|uniref:Uncharacterized protein n=1 Tax=Eretmocerus hayati TaxID=131215 RepID=A0ACC2PSY3_9HYME|nr:hypothetical protein QAD02_021260 [Eretmocerus hayati]